MSSNKGSSTVAAETPSVRTLSPEALRALAEAQERRRLTEETAARDMPKEIDGRGGAEPIRFGDWEVKGLATDF